MDESWGFFPSARVEARGAFLAGHAYFVGGEDTTRVFDQILVLDPLLGGEAAVASCRIPGGISRAGVASDGNAIYVMGGLDGRGAAVADVWRVTIDAEDPTSCAAARIGALPSPRFGGAAVWSGSLFYFLGGEGPSGALDEIVRVTPGGNAQALATRLPRPTYLPAAAWLDGAAYLAGGLTPTVTHRVVRFDPQAGVADYVPALDLPSNRFWSAMVAADRHLLVFGGDRVSGGLTNEIVRLDPTAGGATVMRERLNPPRFAASAVWDGARALLAGGSTRSNEGYRYLSTVARYDVVPPPPTSVTAVSGPSPGEITLTWTPPPANTYLTLAGYRVLRSTIEDATPAQSIAFDVPVGSSFVDYDLVPGIRYWYRLAAVSPQGASPFTETVDTRAAILPSGVGFGDARPFADADGDAVTDDAEALVCGTPATKQIISGIGSYYAGKCTGLEYDATAWSDDDADGVPRQAEPALCALAGSVALAGTCVGQDYGVTPARWSELVGYPDLPLA